MENEPPSLDDGRSSRRGRLMGKFFGKDKKQDTSAATLDAFLHSSADQLEVTHAPPPPPPPSLPKLARLDTTISRYPQALAVNQQAQQNRPMASARADMRSPRKSPRPNKKGMVVRFDDSYPEIIGEGGDESEIPVAEIGKRKRAQPPPAPPAHRSPALSLTRSHGPTYPPGSQHAVPSYGGFSTASAGTSAGGNVAANKDDDGFFQPKPLARTQTGYSSIYEPEDEQRPSLNPPAADTQRGGTQRGSNSPLIPGRAASAKFLGASGRRDEQRRSFIEIHQAQMREAEGQAFAQAARSANTASQRDWEDNVQSAASYAHDSVDSYHQPSISPVLQTQQEDLDYSPAASISSLASSVYPSSSPPQAYPSDGQFSAVSSNGMDGPEQSMAIRTASVRHHDVAGTTRDDAQHSKNIRSPSVRRHDAAGTTRNDTQHPMAMKSPSVRRRDVTATTQDDRYHPMAMRSASVRHHDVVDTGGDDALGAFVGGTKHLFEIFRLHAETIRPLPTCQPKECARAALWWFLKGRMGLEQAVRDRPSSTQVQRQNEIDRQQAYANLAKGYWLCQEAIPEITAAQRLPPDAEVAAVAQGLISALRKLSHSMKRNGFLPPVEPFLPQMIDKSIWLEYPALSQDMVALLSGNWASGLAAMQQPMSTLQLLDALPLGDSMEHFSYGRFMADVFLTEQGREAQRLLLPCILSVTRSQSSTGLCFVIASQNSSVQLTVQDDQKTGPVWNDVRWQSNSGAMDIRLPRGFLLVVQLNQNDYKTAWNMYDFGANVREMLHSRSDELAVFRNNLRSFQYLDADPRSRVFPKESVAQCDVALFEKIYKEPGPAGLRHWHCGFRIAVVTGSRTRTLSGVQHNFSPTLPVQFGFFRADGDAPGLSLKFVNGRQKGQMVFVFGDEKERIRFHTLLTGTAVVHDAKIFASAPLKRFLVSQSIREPIGVPPFSRMPWKAARVVNDEFSSKGDVPPTVLADKLKVVLEYQNGTVADRVNVAPGELRMRLEVSNAKILRILRQPQQDITMSVSEAQVPKELPINLADALQLLKANQTIRTYEFNNLKDLHDFQAALTGFEVIFDALATTFAISRRRMVVPIHKKWEAGYTRIQVVRMEDKHLQLLAFFEDFQHGHCMNFVLKGTDVYETFHRGSKAGVRFVDAKFPLPRVPVDKDGDFDDMAFVCLDLPDLPGEHDDILILFENEADRDLLSKCLPAPARGSSRISSRLR